MSWDQILANTIQSTFHFEKASTTIVSINSVVYMVKSAVLAAECLFMKIVNIFDIIVLSLNMFGGHLKTELFDIIFNNTSAVRIFEISNRIE